MFNQVEVRYGVDIFISDPGHGCPKTDTGFDSESTKHDTTNDDCDTNDNKRVDEPEIFICENKE